ncbi:ABC transporter permease subunit [Desulfovibrio desulfuricans]|uniref:ABC transporter permease subunit n=1 Tax=Desulfovibrio desulfuricans TaxID=876 RepID=A0A4P7UQC6_DESDE|nr:nickel/cobalt ABC transporter permease [Desulfovibrio desulfuricans]QCC85792.1 ABC transporter permease subunit [Desulfovibrio desulfuricans]
MKAYILRRLLLTIPLLLGISFVSFIIIQLSPSDPAEVAVRVNEIVPTDEVLELTREQLGLNKPFLVRYADWMCAVAHGDLGRRYVDNKPVAQELARALPPTLWLALAATLFMAVCSVGMAFVCAMYEGRPVDYLLRGFIFSGTATPGFWAGLLLMWLFSVKLNWLPTSGMQGASSVILPAVTLSLTYISTYARLLRNSMVQNKQKNSVLYARARGLTRGMIWRHIFRNSLQSTLTGLGMSLPKLMAGTFVVETIFAWPGLGWLCVTAIFNRDFPVIQAYVLLMAVLFVGCNLLVDILCAAIDPRLRTREQI